MVKKFLANKKGVKPSCLADWNSLSLFSFGWLVMFRILRGLFVRLRLGSARGLVLCERNVRILYASYIRAGKKLNLEEGCEIVGLSKQGIVFGDRCTVGRFATIRPTNAPPTTSGMNTPPTPPPASVAAVANIRRKNTATSTQSACGSNSQSNTS